MSKWDKVGLIVGAIETIVIGVAGFFAQREIREKLKELDLLSKDGRQLDMDKLDTYCKKVNEDKES